jgi:hypothetical protein
MAAPPAIDYKGWKSACGGGHAVGVYDIQYRIYE